MASFWFTETSQALVLKPRDLAQNPEPTLWLHVFVTETIQPETILVHGGIVITHMNQIRSSQVREGIPEMKLVVKVSADVDIANLKANVYNFSRHLTRGPRAQALTEPTDTGDGVCYRSRYKPEPRTLSATRSQSCPFRAPKRVPEEPRPPRPGS